MKKLISALLLLAMLCTAVSCSGTSSDKTTDTTVSDTAVSDITETTAKQSSVPDDLDFEGKTFTLNLWENGNLLFYTVAEELNGDSLNDALFYRYQKTGEALNVEFAFSKIQNEITLIDRMINSVLAGDNAYQLNISQRATSLIKMVESRAVINFNDLPYIDLDDDYWYKSANDVLTVDDYTYFTYGDIYPMSCHIFFFNKDIQESYHLENPLDMVFDGTWTYDVMFEQSTSVSEDLDGNGVMDKNDRYGLTFYNGDSVCSMMYGMGESLNVKTGDGVIMADVTDRRVEIFDRIYKLCYTDNSCYNKIGELSFDTGRVLYSSQRIHGAREFRQVEFDYGMLPYPKYDEAQEKYISFLNTEVMSIPNGNDHEFVGAVMQKLAEESGDVKTAYYEYLLMEKVARDSQSSKVIDILFENPITEFSIHYCGGMTNCYSIYLIPYKAVLSGSSEYTSEFAKYKEAADIELENVYEAILLS